MRCSSRRASTSRWTAARITSSTRPRSATTPRYPTATRTASADMGAGATPPGAGEERLVPRPGPAFGAVGLASRPTGAHRIAGASGALEPEAERRLRASLGERARLLDARRTGALLADLDGCSVGDAPVATEEALAAVIRGGELGALE